VCIARKLTPHTVDIGYHVVAYVQTDRRLLLVVLRLPPQSGRLRRE